MLTKAQSSSRDSPFQKTNKLIQYFGHTSNNVFFYGRNQASVIYYYGWNIYVILESRLRWKLS